MLRKNVLRSIGIALAWSACAFAPRATEAVAAPVTIKIIGFNDYHGNLQTPGTFGVNTLVPSAQRPAVGGAEYLGAYVAQLKAVNPNNVVVEPHGDPQVGS